MKQRHPFSMVVPISLESQAPALVWIARLLYKINTILQPEDPNQTI